MLWFKINPVAIHPHNAYVVLPAMTGVRVVAVGVHDDAHNQIAVFEPYKITDFH
jgi:hypothetical protein